MTLRERHIVDAFKGLTGPFVLGLMSWFDAFDRTDAWIYLALHGTYGVLWVLKSRVFPDKSWERPVRPLRGVILVVGLLGYWVAPVLLLQTHQSSAPPALLGAMVALWGLGVFLHFTADMQKHMAMQLRPGELWTGGLWSRTRNPNYLGELCIYLALATMSRHWIPFVVFGLVVAAEWIPNMRRKDRSLSRYPGWKQWRDRSGVLLPRLW